MTKLHLVFPIGKFDWEICSTCRGHGRVGSAYDVICSQCRGDGKVQEPIVAALTFAEKRRLAAARRELRRAAALERAISKEEAPSAFHTKRGLL